MQIWLASFPRSGNNFFRIVLSRVFGLMTDSVYPESLEVALQLHGPLARDWKPRPDQPRITKTHELPGQDDRPAVYLIRDGRDAIVSYAHFILRFERADDPASQAPDAAIHVMRDLIEYEASFGGWGNHVTAWLNRLPRPIVVRFEELIREPVQQVGGALERAGFAGVVAATPQALPRFEDLNRMRPNLFRRGRIGSFRDEMPPDLQEKFWSKYGRIMDELGYPRS